jgi:glycosyltransferase involved in cell wall biosynthesis
VLAILTTHPIQYQVPLWEALARDGRIPFEVWYLTKHAAQLSQDREFGKSFAWDLEMLSGYPHRFLSVDPRATPNTFWKCRFRRDFADELRRAKAKAIWIQGWQVAAYWQAVWAAKKAGAEVWLRGESNDLAPKPFWKREIKRVVLGQFFRRVDRFLYIGTANRRLYESFGVPKDQLYPAPYAVDNERFAAQAAALRPSRLAIRDSWGIPKDAFCVLFCGKFIPKKRPLDLVKAAKLLLESGSALSPSRGLYQAGGQPPSSLPMKVHLLFVGSGELGSELRANCNIVFDAESVEPTINREPITDNAKPRASFAGFLNQTQVSKAYVAADCLVLPSDYRETWGLVVNEVMASGLPCVISDECGCAEDLGMTRPNTIFSCGSIGELAVKIASSSKVENPSIQPNPPSFSTTVETAVALYG